MVAAQKSSTHGLNSFQMKPKDLKGETLLLHMSKLIRCFTHNIFETVGCLGLEMTD